MAGFSVQVALSTTGLSSSLWPFSTTSGYVYDGRFVQCTGTIYTMQTLHNADFVQCILCTQCTLLKEIVLGASCGII